MSHVVTVVSGGQTGVDRAALDAAQAVGIPASGWCPKDRRAEDGRIDARYPLKETPSRAYAQRTTWNVRDSDGTLVLVFNRSSPGTILTLEEARVREKALFIVDLSTHRIGSVSPANWEVATWVRENDIRVLNVAGPRESEAPGAYAAARALLEDIFRQFLSPGRHDEEM